MGLYKQNDVAAATSFNNSGEIFVINPPSLNITAYFYAGDDVNKDVTWNYFPWGQNWKNPISGATPFAETSVGMYVLAGKIYDVITLSELGSCQQTLDPVYKWGFSFVLLFLSLLLTMIWAVGMYWLWMDAYLHSRFDADHKDLGMERAILDLSTALREDIGQGDRDQLSNTELQRKMDEMKQSRNIRAYFTSDHSALPNPRDTKVKAWRQNLKPGKWAWTEKWWLLLWTATLVLTILAWSLPMGIPILLVMIPFVGITCTIFIGGSHPSRWIIAVASIIIGLALLPISPAVFLDYYGNYDLHRVNFHKQTGLVTLTAPPASSVFAIPTVTFEVLSGTTVRIPGVTALASTTEWAYTTHTI